VPGARREIAGHQWPGASAGVGGDRSAADRVHTGHGDIPSSVKAIKAGAGEFLSKLIGAEVLLRAVDAAIALDRTARKKRSELAELQTRYSRLTPREREVLPFVVAGFENKVTAARSRDQ
jgi:FixJ family two-component response regulator